MNIPYIFKKCARCGEWLVANNINFYKHKKGKHGLKSKCKECEKQYYQDNKEQLTEYKKQYYQERKEEYKEINKQYRQEHKEEIAKCKKEWYKENREQHTKKCKQYYQEHKEEIAKCKKEWYKENREKVSERYKQWKETPQGQIVTFNNSNKRRLLKEQQGKGINKEQWLEMMNFFNWTGAYSGVVLTKENRSIDHIIPISKGGLNEPWNCVPMERSLNSSKNKQDMLEWYQEQPFYSEERLAKIYEWQEYAYNKWGQDVAM